MANWDEARLDDIFGATVLNSGFGQDRTWQVLWRLQTTDWHGQSPRDVLLLVGTNNLSGQTCDVYWGIRAVVAKAHSVFANARVIVVGILPRGDDMLQFDDKIRAVNADLKAAAAAAHFAFFDPHDAFLCDHHTPCELFIPDHNLHLTPKGYDLLDGLLRQFLAKNQMGQNQTGLNREGDTQ
jgi:platelet-activating factor acetylhydrolase IB subunit beta/gamma